VDDYITCLRERKRKQKGTRRRRIRVRDEGGEVRSTRGDVPDAGRLRSSYFTIWR